MMEGYHREIFEEDLKEMGISITNEQMFRFIRYYEMLTEWNRRMNLTAITEYEEVLKKYFVDSLSLVHVYDIRNNDSVIDVGTGAGFPGLALKIAFPDMEITLLDSLNKRIQFLNAVIEELGLKGVRTVHGRAEDFARPGELRESFDLCVSRAVANLATLAEYCLPFVKKGGLFIAYKAENASRELTAAQKAIAILGGRTKESLEFVLPNSDISRTLFVIEKEMPTPLKYPRKAGLPGKEPICMRVSNHGGK